MGKVRRNLSYASFLALISLASLFFATCGKKAPPLPPTPIVPAPYQDAKVTQVGDKLLFSFKPPLLNTENKPAEIGKIVIYKLKEPRMVVASTQTQTAPAQTQTMPAQTQSAPVASNAQAQTQSAPMTQSAPQTQTQTAQTQTQSQPQTQTQTQTQQLPPENPRSIPSTEFEERAEEVIEIPADQVAGYMREGIFVFTEPVILTPGSEDLTMWSYYAAELYNPNGKRAPIGPIQALFPAIVPMAPKNFLARAAEKQITLTWAAVTQDIQGNPITEVTYNVYRSSTANFAGLQPLNSTPLTETSHVDTTFQHGQPYYYFVQATSTRLRPTQLSEPSNAVLLFPQDTYPPGAPQELNAVAAKEGMVLIWAPNSEEDVAGYQLYRSTETGKDYIRINRDLIRETTYTDTEAQAGTRYYYVLKAVDNAPTPNESPYSTEVSEEMR